MLMQWHLVTSAEYKAGVKVAEDLYFLSDTHEIRRGEDNYGVSMFLYNRDTNAEFTHPNIEKPSVNALYIEKTTLEGWIYDGTEWHTAVKAVAETVDPNGTAPVTGKAVATYIAAQLEGMTDVITDITYDATEHMVSVFKNDTTAAATFVLTGLGCSLVSTKGADGAVKIQLKDAAGEMIGDAVNLDMDRLIKNAYYDETTKKLVFIFENTDTVLPSDPSYAYPDNMPTGEAVVAGVYVKVGEVYYKYDGTTWAETSDTIDLPLEIDVSDLIPTYTGEATTSIDLTVVGSKISAALKVSAAEGNAVVVKDDGLYVPTVDISGKADKVTDAVAGDIATLTAEGQLADSGKKVGGKTLAETPDENTLATEAAVKTAVAGKVDTSSIHNSTNMATSVDTASDDVLVSEKAIVGAMSWKYSM